LRHLSLNIPLFEVLALLLDLICAASVGPKGQTSAPDIAP